MKYIANSEVTTMQLKFVILFSAIVLFSGTNSEEVDFDSDGQYRNWVINRTDSSLNSPGYYILPVDKTAFRVSQLLYLYQFDVSKIYAYDPENEVPLEKPIRVRARIIEYLESEQYEKVLYDDRIVLSSNREARVRVRYNGRSIVLRPQYLYHIQLDLPENVRLMYNDLLEIKEYTKLVSDNKYIRVKFYQHNSAAKPPGLTDYSRVQSLGMVKRIHLKYSVA